MKASVLVVDDARDAGQEFVRLIQNATGMETLFAASGAEALAVVAENPIKVAVLDQRIGMELGTDVHNAIREIDPFIRSVMFSGAASPQEVGTALQRGYGVYLAKQDVARLGETVTEQLLQYDLDAAVAQSSFSHDPFFIRKHGVWPYQRRVKYFLMDVTVLPLLPSSLEWKQAVRIGAGETKTITEVDQSTIEFVIESATTESVSTRLGLSPKGFAGLSSSLGAEVAARISNSSSDVQLRSVTQERTFQLPAEPTDPDTLHVKSRLVERARVVQSIRLTVTSTCQCCSSTTIAVMNAGAPTMSFRTRQTDYLSDGTHRMIDTGMEAAG